MALAPFVRLGSGRHPTIDLDALEAEYPNPEKDDATNVSSACTLLAWERTRRRFGMKARQSFPCDVFVWGKGTAPDPRMTRIGGVPFFPRRMTWPTIDGCSATFLCQFDFSDSRDLVQKLPADVLLVFVRDDESLVTGQHFAFTWVANDERDLITSKEVPAATRPFTFIEAWGVRHRTVDIPHWWRQHDGDDDPDDLSLLPVVQATKIGGIPYDSQDRHFEPPVGYLCQVCSVQACPGVAWPWVDRRSRLSNRFDDKGIYGDTNQLMFGDMGELTFQLGAKGAISVSAACG